jgi:outer membrane receptor for ferrienterochelin and colicins
MDRLRSGKNDRAARPGRRLLAAACCLPPLLLLASVRALAQPAAVAPVPTSPPAPMPAPTPERSQLSREDLSLEELLNPNIWVATKSALHAAQTPAVVTVVTADEIAARAYRSLADVLRSVPGFYDVYDGVTHNVGIRGINAGQAASGSNLKLMIDGQPVDYRPTSGNFFGEELIPIDVIERVEIIRGPASALYGADAFLGAINVVTKSGEALAGAHLVAQGAMVRGHAGGGGGFIMAGKGGSVDVLVAASYLYLDRSGRTLPGSSPLLPNAAVTAHGPSRQDTAEPGTVFFKVGLSDVLTGKLTLLATMQRLDAHGEYQYFGPLDERTRIAELNQTYRLSYEVTPVESVSLFLSGSFFNSEPTSDAQYGTGHPDYVMIPSRGASGYGVNAEVRVSPHPMLALTAGGDMIFEDNLTETYDQKLLTPVLAQDGSVLRLAGTVIPGEMHGLETDIQNLGAFVQGMVTPNEDWNAIVGVRLDQHNVYGSHVSERVGLVYVHDVLSVKLLYGSSFKAPSAAQLYARPVAFGGVLGNPTLSAQTAQSTELAVGLRLPDGWGDVQVNGFVTSIKGRVEFLPTGSYVIADNTQDERVAGGEFAAHVVPIKRLRLNLHGSMAETISRSGTIEGLLGKPDVPNPMFPKFQFGAIADFTLPWAGLTVSAELAAVGARPASFSNSVIRGSAYDLDPYLFSALAVSASGPWLFDGRQSRISLRIDDLLNRRWAEPGFGGVDVPTQGTTTMLTLRQGF